jgi:hypothetical protein
LDTLTIMETESLTLGSTYQNSTEQETCKRHWIAANARFGEPMAPVRS